MIEMTNADEFYQYAKECLRDAEKPRPTKTEASSYISPSIGYWRLHGLGAIQSMKDVMSPPR
jgi:hypothetical protein